MLVCWLPPAGLRVDCSACECRASACVVLWLCGCALGSAKTRWLVGQVSNSQPKSTLRIVALFTRSNASPTTTRRTRWSPDPTASPACTQSRRSTASPQCVRRMLWVSWGFWRARQDPAGLSLTADLNLGCWAGLCFGLFLASACRSTYVACAPATLGPTCLLIHKHTYIHAHIHTHAQARVR